MLRQLQDLPLLVALRCERLTFMLDGMKTLTTREFFHSPGLVKSLRPGQSLAVTDNGVPAFTVKRAGQRSRRTRAGLEREAREISSRSAPKVNLTQALRELKGR